MIIPPGILACLLATTLMAVDDGPIDLPGPLIPFAFAIKTQTPAEQVARCTRLGFAGMCLPGTTPEVFKRFAEVPEVRSGAFGIPCALWWTKVDQPPSASEIDAACTGAAALHTALWMVVAGRKDTDFERAVDLYRRVAIACRTHSAQLVLYPHQGQIIESAEESLALWQRLDCPEVRLSIHLCHELKAGNGERIAEVVDRIAPHLGLVSVSGADRDTRTRGGWETGIMPLDRGTYDVRPFLRALAAHHYAGPVILHTFGITDPVDEHYARSLAAWRRLTGMPADAAH